MLGRLMRVPPGEVAPLRLDDRTCSCGVCTTTKRWLGKEQRSQVNWRPRCRGAAVKQRIRTLVYASSPPPPQQKNSDFAGTSPAVKGLVSGLTGLLLAFNGERSEEEQRRIERRRNRSPIRPEELHEGIREDFESGYLWTGIINDSLYEEDCRFTDPTLSFVGLSTFQKNIAALTPVLKRALRSFEVVLHSCELEADQTKVVAEWEMKGELVLPWKPRVQLKGRTEFTYNDQTGRVYSYDETWGISAWDAVLQLVRPSKTDT